MVTDSLQNLEQYRGLHKNMDTVIDFLKKCVIIMSVKNT